MQCGNLPPATSSGPFFFFSSCSASVNSFPPFFSRAVPANERAAVITSHCGANRRAAWERWGDTHADTDVSRQTWRHTLRKVSGQTMLSIMSSCLWFRLWGSLQKLSSSSEEESLHLEHLACRGVGGGFILSSSFHSEWRKAAIREIVDRCRLPFEEG